MDNQREIHGRKPTDLERHVMFWDGDGDGFIHASDIWRGFRDLGFSIPYCLVSLLIPLLFSYATQPGHPHHAKRDPRFRICVRNVDRTIHSSHTGVFDDSGRFDQGKFDAMFDRFDTARKGRLTTVELFQMWRANCNRNDPGGWLYSFMEFLTTWLLIQEHGQISKADLQGCYEGSLFYTIRRGRRAERRKQA
ncbi:hypothetical protein A1O3_02370 [Capronia epimyces CBS 606.96]|uniref:EF-hand domain-containing protein n=1 Tax=Capronia epimyces CBS 606.96 TaxID=1182542 RepID=W9Z463_9EURO|nr:uncharacterized protein A1O3_02370 [Capronia epimyces CBS 606.96]EXJ89304.1 hypothetical protein A1O3_02370 [Capronia epimyces CBS 606.96]